MGKKQTSEVSTIFNLLVAQGKSQEMVLR